MFLDFGDLVQNALNRIGTTVHDSELNGLSPVDKMHPPTMTQVIQDCGYGYGRVDFAIPYLRQYLREHATYIRMAAGLDEAQAEGEG